MRISLVSNTNMSELIRRISKLGPCYTPDGYGVWLQELLWPDAPLFAEKDNNIFILLDGNDLFKNNLHSMPEIMAEIDEYFRYFEQTLQDHPGESFFISNLDILDYHPYSLKQIPVGQQIESYWQCKLQTLLASWENAYLFDSKALCMKVGQDSFYSSLLWYSGGLRYASVGEKLIAEKIGHILRSKYGMQYKCIVLDMDNTLWGGVLGEEGPEGVELAETLKGARYKDFQRVIRSMTEYGVILAAASKNNMADVQELFARNTQMVLDESDFVNLKIDWNPKANNIAQIAQELNIGLDSFVFIDDNPVERASVKESLPMVQVPDFPQNTTKLPAFAKEVYDQYFLKLSITSEDAGKTKMYRADQERKLVEKVAVSQAAFLNSLHTRLVLRIDSLRDVNRIAQLTQKTNQFNVLTKRYQNEDILRLMNLPQYMVWGGSISDKFGDLGLSLVLILYCPNESEAYIDTLLMSCRVMGRELEFQFLRYIAAYLQEHGFKKIYAAYEKTQKNKPVENFFEAAGFLLLQEDAAAGRKDYVLDLEMLGAESLMYMEITMEDEEFAP